jgi:dienelactone hydrolase
MFAWTVTLRTDAGSSFGAYLAGSNRPNGASVVVLQEIFGVNANMRSVAEGLATAGFTAIVPDLFWRQQPGVELNPATDRERATELMKGLDQDLAVMDALLAAHYVRTLNGGNGKVGAVGYWGKLASAPTLSAPHEHASPSQDRSQPGKPHIGGSRRLGRLQAPQLPQSRALGSIPDSASERQ